MEAGNVLFVPGLAYWLGQPKQPLEIFAFALSAFAAGGLLIVGALYWHALDRRLRLRDRTTMDRALKFADAAQRPMLVTTAAAAAGFAGALTIHGGRPAVIAAGVLTLLAALEYVNYYHRQLQHFDNAADLKRLLTTWKPRRAHLARDLASYRRRER